MGPKKGKDTTADENYWRTCIEDAPLDEENWKVKVILIEAAGSDQDRIYLNKFELFAAEEKRFVIKNICKTEATFMINQLGGEKKIKDDNLRVFEEAQSYLKDKKDIPSEVLALVIKHLILKMKEEYLFIKRQRLEVREGLRRESTTMINKTEVRGTVSVKQTETPEISVVPPGKNKKGETETTPQIPELTEGKKYNTSLRVRGEEWRDKVYVDDFPQDGPNLYVAVTGFMEPFLAGCLVKIGVPLTAIIQVRIDSSTTRVPSSLFRSTKRGQSQTEILTEKSMKFWEDLQQLRIHRDTSDLFKNTAFLIFSPPYWDSESLTGIPVKIYDELCYLLYDIQDLSRQHCHYLENMDIINISMNIQSEDLISKCYQQQIQDLPLECVTIYSLLDCMLQTVSNYQGMDEKPSRTSLSTAVTMNKLPQGEENEKVAKAEKLVKDIFNTLCKTDETKKSYRVTYGEEYEYHKDPIIINYGDVAKLTTFHLGNINLGDIVWNTLLGMPINGLWHNQIKIQGEIEAKINYHVNVLLSCFERDDVETSELKRLIHILACRKLYNNRSSLKKKHLQSSTISEFKKVFLKRSVLAEPLPQCPLLNRNSSTRSFPSITKSDNSSNSSYEDDPDISRIKFLFDCPDISELASAAEIANGHPISHMIDDYEHFEDFTGNSAFQILLEAFNKFNCVDYKYCEVTDCFVLMFYNSHDKDGIARDEWRSHISTPCCLQDFFDFVLEEHYDWIQKEEKIYDETCVIRAQSECQESANPLAGTSCIENVDVDVELLMEGSLKYLEKTEINDEGPENIDANTISKKPTISPTSVEDSKSSRKAKSTPASTPKHLRQSVIAIGTASDTSAQIPRKEFIGYDLGDRRVEVFGQNSTYFSDDGTQVITKYTLTIPYNLEYITLNIVPGNKVNEFWLHKALGEYVTPELTDMCESFRITSKDEVLINIKKQVYQVPLIPPSISEYQKMKGSTKNSVDKDNDENMQMFAKKYFHSLLVTWPNGHITESVHLDNSPEISHIKQFYLKPLSKIDEDMRCVSLNGEVIIFRPSGFIEVLKPDGSIIKITKCGKRVVQTDPLEDIASETSSDKSKKGKGKEKEKNKVSKASSKSSKNGIHDEPSEVKSPEYELFIEEFEIIESSGLRQKWINEIPYTIEKLLIRTATDYCLREVYSRRMDGTSTLCNKDGLNVVTFPNNTRIITQYIIEDEEIYPEWTDEEKEYFDILDLDFIDTDTLNSKHSLSQKSCTYPHSRSVASSNSKRFDSTVQGEEQIKELERSDGYISVQIIFTIEHENFTTITIDKSNGNISVESPNNTKVVMDMSNNYNITLDDTTRASFNGQSLNIDYEACVECSSITTVAVTVILEDMCSVTTNNDPWLEMRDSFGKSIVVDKEGHISMAEEPHSVDMCPTEEGSNVEDCNETADVKRHDNKSEMSLASQSHGKCRMMYQAKKFRFFIFNRDLTCSELVHRALLDNYTTSCRWQPWCSISQYDTFGDHRSLLSILTPIHLTETEKWRMESKLANKPKHLTYKDLKQDTGKGFYHWMRPYERFHPKPMKPETLPLPRLPRAFVLRTLEQQWKEDERQNVKGASELLNAILRYRNIMESDSENILQVPIKDNRSENERRTDDLIQVLGHRIYEDLKQRLNEDVEHHAKASIITRPMPVASEPSVEGELEEDDLCKQQRLEEERECLVQEAKAAEDMSPNLARYWRRRAEELKEEQFYKYLLRKGCVPPYFRNVLGGAIWWEMNNAAGDAADLAERKKMECACADEGTSQTEDTVLTS